MLSKYSIRLRVPARTQFWGVTSCRAWFATFMDLERVIEYDIDLISLKRTPKQAMNPFKLAKWEAQTIKQDIITRSIEESKKDPLDYKRYPEYDNKGHMEFIERYNHEVRTFLQFVSQTRDKPVEQLTHVEVLNGLFLFKNKYQRAEVEDVNKYNYTSYNYMFERLHKYLRHDSGFLAFLQNNLCNDFKNSKTILDLYRFGIGKYMKELTSLSRELDFGMLSTTEISDSLDKVIKDFDKFLQSHDTNADFGEEFFKCCIQIQRYRHLKSILDHVPVEPHHLSYMVHNENSKLVVQRINRLSGDYEKFKNMVMDYKAEMNFINFLQKDSFTSFPKISSFLYNTSTTSNDDISRKISLTLLETFTPFFINGTIKDTDMDMIELEAITPITVSNVARENYEFSVLAKLELFDFVDELKILRSYMNKDYGNYVISDLFEHLDKLINSFRGSNLILDNLQILELELCRLSEFISWDLSILDKLIDNPSSIAYLKEVCTSNYESTNGVSFLDRSPIIPQYTQIPDSLNLHEFSAELKVVKTDLFGGFDFKNFSPAGVISVLEDAIINVQDLTEATPNIRQDNIGSFIKLNKKISELFETNGGCTAILDTVIYSQSVFDGAEKKINGNHTHSTTYTQLPDDCELHKYNKELIILRDELGSDYKSLSAGQVKSFLTTAINDFINDETAASFILDENVDRFIRLEEELNKLFVVNRPTSILDTLIHSQIVFEGFEKITLQSKLPYKQVPDSFMLEDYILELLQLKTELGISQFKDCSCKAILDKLKLMINNNKKYNLDKRITYSKLYRNISYLFKYNGDESFILDNVLVSGEVFARFESDKKFKKNSENSDSFISQNVKFINKYGENINQLFIQLKINDVSDLIGLNESKFSDLLTQFLISKKDNHQYSTYLDMAEKIRLLNRKINNYPFFLYGIIQKRNKGISINKETIESTQEEVNHKLHEVLGKNKVKLSIPNTETSNKFDINDFIEESVIPKGQFYNDSDKLLAALSKQTDSAEIDLDKLAKNRYVKDNLLKCESDIKDAVSAAFSSGHRRVTEENTTEYEELNNLTAEKVRESFKKYSPTIPTSTATSKVDKSSVESFLKNAKKEKDLAKERKFRESKAYEWSKSMYNSHRSLESHNFFDPVIPMSKMSKNSNKLFFPKVNVGDIQYLVLTINGKIIMSKENPLGKNYIQEDMLTILNKFNEDDLNKFIKNVKKLQKKNWRLIGSGGENEKMLVLTRNKSNKKSIFLTRLKTIFATTGAVFFVLAGLNLWLGEDSSNHGASSPGPVDDDKRNRTEAILRTSIDTPATVNEPNNTTSAWKHLLWSTR